MDVKTAPELLRYVLETHKKPDAFLVRRAGVWTRVSTEEYAAHVAAAAAWLKERGVGRGDRVVILSESRYEWVVADMAILSIGAVSVPFYATLPAGQITPLVADSGAIGAFVSDRGQRDKLITAESATTLRWIYSFDEDGLPAPLAGATRASAASSAATSIAPDDVATIIYTSGTTGTPKGVMLTHGNIAAEVQLSLQSMKIASDDLYLSFLPLSHVFERVSGFYTMFYAGAAIAYAESFDRLATNLREVHPTVILAVPRLYEKVLSRARETAAGSGGFTRAIFEWAYGIAMEWGERRNAGRAIPPVLALQHAIAGALVYKKIARGMGGRTRLRVSGGAPLNRDVALFYLGAGLAIHEGYGLTETSSAISVNTFEIHRVGTVGPILRGVDVRIAEDGEVLVRGPIVMKGYWQKPEETAAVLQDGWFQTGDIGEIDADKCLRITDRKKDLLVTSGGKKVAPQPIEAALKSSPRIAEALVVGDGQKYIAALILPAPGATREQIAEDVERVNGSLAQFERIKRFELIPDNLTIENGLMTPSLKLKRKAVIAHHRELVARLFQGA